jgi:hypothetical protein
VSASRRHLANVPFYSPGCIGGEVCEPVPAGVPRNELSKRQISKKTNVAWSLPHWHYCGESLCLKLSGSASQLQGCSRWLRHYITPCVSHLAKVMAVESRPR